MENFKYETDFNIQLGDIGECNVLTNKAVLRFMQEAGALHTDSIGYGLNDNSDNNFAWILLNWNLKVFFRPKWNEIIHIKTWSRKVEKIYSYRDYELYCNNKLVAIATSKWVAIKTSNSRIMKLSDEIIKEYKTTNISVFEQEPAYELKVPEHFINFYSFRTERRDIDTNHHVNNLFYLDFAYSALPEDIYYNRFSLNNIEIAYKKEIKLGDTIKCSYAFENNKHIVVISNVDGSIVHSIIYLY